MKRVSRLVAKLLKNTRLKRKYLSKHTLLCIMNFLIELTGKKYWTFIIKKNALVVQVKHSY